MRHDRKIVFIAIAILIGVTALSLVVVADHKVSIVSYMNAADYVGQTVTINTPINYGFYEKGKELFFSSRAAPHHAHLVPDGGDTGGFFTISIPDKFVSLFPTNYAEILHGKEILVTGEVTWFQGDPHIIVTKPSQIRLL